MTVEEAKEYAKTMSYEEAVYNALQGRAVPYKKATKIKLDELIENQKSVIEELEKIKEIYKKLADESVKNHIKGNYYIGKTTAYGVAISTIDEKISKLKGE